MNSANTTSFVPFYRQHRNRMIGLRRCAAPIEKKNLSFASPKTSLVFKETVFVLKTSSIVLQT